VSAYTKPGYVSNDTLDFGSLLFFVEQNFGLGFIGSGASIYSNYADYHAAARGDMADFFTLSKPRTFTPITSTMKAKDFINAPPSSMPPDDD
jgi:phospholipase C